jgi:hypothetical protein
MISFKRTLAAGLAVAAFAGTLSGFAAPARADWDDHHGRREYRDRVYVSPPVVYGPPPPPYGLNLLFNVR